MMRMCPYQGAHPHFVYKPLAKGLFRGGRVEEGRGCRYLCTLPDESVWLPRPIRIVVKEMRGAGRGVIPAIQ